MSSGQSVVEIVCDESGNTGENVTQIANGVFAEGSHDLSPDEALEVIRWVRTQTGSKAAEIKWKQLRDQQWLIAELFQQKMAGRSRIYLVEKTYFTVGKVVDLLLEEHAFSEGRDLYSTGVAKEYASLLYRDGPRALGAENWTALLRAFNSLMRHDTATQRLRSTPKATVDEFFDLLDRSRHLARRRNVARVLTDLAKTKSIAEQFVHDLDASTTKLSALDPLIPSVAQTVRHWAADHKGKTIRVIHDQGPLPSSGALDVVVDGLRDPGEFRRLAPAVDIASIDTADSKSDVRVQLADLIAGFGSHVGFLALTGALSEDLAEIARPMIASSSLWGHDDSARTLGLSM